MKMGGGSSGVLRAGSPIPPVWPDLAPFTPVPQGLVGPVLQGWPQSVRVLGCPEYDDLGLLCLGPAGFWGRWGFSMCRPLLLSPPGKSWMVPGAEGTRARPTSPFPHYFSKGKRPTFQPIGLEPVPRLIALAPLPRPLPHPQPISHVLDPLPEEAAALMWKGPSLPPAQAAEGSVLMEQAGARARLILSSALLWADPFEGHSPGHFECPVQHRHTLQD